jgi:hypothetical protein
MALRWFGLASVVAMVFAVAIAGLDCAPSAKAAPALVWSSPKAIPGAGALGGVSCPSVSFCATFSGPLILTSEDPSGGPKTWRATSLAPRLEGYDILAISCASAQLCIAVGDGFIASSTRPGGDARAWRVTHLGQGYWHAASCPSRILCVVLDQRALIAVSTNPTGGASAWTVATAPKTVAEAGSSYCAITLCQTLNAVSCASASFCVAVEDDNESTADAVVMTHPAAPATWAASAILTGPTYGGLSGIACPSVTLCITAQPDESLLVSADPSSPSAAWTATTLSTGSIGNTDVVPAIACGSSSLCAETWGPQIVVSVHPTRGPAAWNAQTIARFSLSGVSCISARICVAVDNAGNAIVGRKPPAPTRHRHPR